MKPRLALNSLYSWVCLGHQIPLLSKCWKGSPEPVLHQVNEVLVMRLWASCTLGKHSVNWASSQVQQLPFLTNTSCPTSIFVLFYILFYVWIFCLHVCPSTVSMVGAYRIQKRSTPLELELQMIMNHHLNNGSLTCIPWKSSKCSWALRHLLSLLMPF